MTAKDYAKLLVHAEAIRDFLSDKSACSVLYWDDNGEEMMHTDIGYFDTGLTDLIEYLKRKAR